MRDIVGLYLHPPDKVLVLCADEKTQIQARDRSQPLLPMRPGQAERRTDDYKRHGTTSLFAALEVKSGRVLGDFHARHRSVEFRKFLDRIEAAVPTALDVHLILDNYAAHKTPLIHRWLARHPRFHVHFTPTGASWLNLVERWFAALTEKQIRRGVHRSTRDLEDAIRHIFKRPTIARSPLFGPKPPTKSWQASPVFVNDSLTQDASDPALYYTGTSMFRKGQLRRGSQQFL